MVERTVGIGETSSCRYFGVRPPLEEEEIQKVKGGLELPWWVGSFELLGVTQEASDDCSSHTEFGVDVGTALDWLGEEVVDKGTVQIANSIADLLRQDGGTVLVQEEIVAIDYRTPIFGEEYNEQREFIRRHSQLQF